MKRLGNFINAIYSFYVFGTYFFFMTAILIFTAGTVWLPEKIRLIGFYRFSRLMTGMWGLITGVWMSVIHAKKRDPKQTYVFVGNHLNIFDILMIGTLIPHPMRVVVKREFLKVPILGFIISLVTIMIDRTTKRGRAQGMKDMSNCLKRGISITVFAEGTRNRTGEPLKKFHDGAFVMAIQSQKPIMPFLLINTRQIQPVDTFRARPGHGRLMLLDPIPTEGLKDSDVQALKAKVHDIMEAAILEHEPYFQQGAKITA